MTSDAVFSLLTAAFKALAAILARIPRRGHRHDTPLTDAERITDADRR